MVDVIRYKFHEVTKEYIGPHYCQPNPEQPGSHIYPPLTTEIEPLTGVPHQTPVFDTENGVWVSTNDYRGVLSWDDNGEMYYITELGVTPRAEPPPTLLTPIWNGGVGAFVEGATEETVLAYEKGEALKTIKSDFETAKGLLVYDTGFGFSICNACGRLEVLHLMLKYGDLSYLMDVDEIKRERQFTVEEINGIIAGMELQHYDLLIKYDSKITAIKTASTVSEVKNIKWTD